MAETRRILFPSRLSTAGMALAAAGLVTLGACGSKPAATPSEVVVAAAPTPTPTPTPAPTPEPTPEPTPTPTPPPTPPPTPTPSPINASVTITAAGVSPKTVTITVGGKVNFINSSSAAHDIGADPPGSCPQVDGAIIAPGGSRFSGVFSAATTCGYHDDLNPSTTSLQGTIVIQ